MPAAAAVLALAAPGFADGLVEACHGTWQVSHAAETNGNGFKPCSR